MGNIITDLREKYRSGDICIRFIYLNAAVFVVVQLLAVCFSLFRLPLGWLHLLELPSSWSFLGMQPWSLLTYMFMHAGLLHLLFNMLWLYSFGRLFLVSYSARHFRGLYLLGGLSGGLFYLAAFSLFPFFQDIPSVVYLSGASASVLAIVVAAAVNDPERPLNFFLLGTIRVKYVALLVVLLDLLLVTSGNSGGHVAHLGGAFAGWLFAYGLRKGRFDATSWVNALLDMPVKLFATKKNRPKPKMKVHYGGGRSQDYEFNARKRQQEDDIDRILDKLKKSGYDHLTVDEKKKLFDASRK